MEICYLKHWLSHYKFGSDVGYLIRMNYICVITVEYGVSNMLLALHFKVFTLSLWMYSTLYISTHLAAFRWTTEHLLIEGWHILMLCSCQIVQIVVTSSRVAKQMAHITMIFWYQVYSCLLPDALLLALIRPTEQIFTDYTISKNVLGNQQLQMNNQTKETNVNCSSGALRLITSE